MDISALRLRDMKKDERGKRGDSPATGALGKCARDCCVRLIAPLSVVVAPAVAAPRPPI